MSAIKNNLTKYKDIKAHDQIRGLWHYPHPDNARPG